MSNQFLQTQVSESVHSDQIWNVEWTASNRILSISADGTAACWDAAGKKSHATPTHPLGLVSVSASSSPNTGEKAVLSSVEGTVFLWDIESQSVLAKRETFNREKFEESTWCVSMHPSGDSYVSTGNGGSIFICSTDQESFGETKGKLAPGRVKFGMCVKHSPDGNHVAMSSDAGQIYVFNLETRQIVVTYASHAMCVRSLAWSFDNQLLLSGSDDKRLLLHDLRVPPPTTQSGHPRLGAGAVAALSGHASWALCVSLSADAKLAASGSADKTVRIWDIGARKSLAVQQHAGEVWGVSWRPLSAGGGSTFVTGGESRAVEWWSSAGVS